MICVCSLNETACVLWIVPLRHLVSRILLSLSSGCHEVGFCVGLCYFKPSTACSSRNSDQSCLLPHTLLTSLTISRIFDGGFIFKAPCQPIVILNFLLFIMPPVVGRPSTAEDFLNWFILNIFLSGINEIKATEIPSRINQQPTMESEMSYVLLTCPLCVLA